MSAVTILHSITTFTTLIIPKQKKKKRQLLSKTKSHKQVSDKIYIF